MIPSLQGHFAASPAKAADVEFMNRTIIEFLENITEGGKKLNKDMTNPGNDTRPRREMAAVAAGRT
jgi:hypothetical protein